MEFFFFCSLKDLENTFHENINTKVIQYFIVYIKYFKI